MASASAHGFLSAPQPRDGAQDNDGASNDNKGGANLGACGTNDQATAGAPSANLVAGQTMSVSWTTAIPHGGTVRIAISTVEVAEGDSDRGAYQLNADGSLVSFPTQ